MKNHGGLAAPGAGVLQQGSGTGDASAFERLVPIVYSELHRLAHRQMAGEPRSPVLQPAALVNEAFVRLTGSGGGWQSRQQFASASAPLMRQVLVDLARDDETWRRGGRDAQFRIFEVDELSKPQPSISIELLIDIDQALSELEALDEKQAQVVQLRFFGGLENSEIARILGVSERAVIREWRLARAFLFHSLGSKP